MVEKRIIEIQFIKSEDKIPDSLTKNVKEKTFNKHAKKINNGKVRYDAKQKGKVNDKNYETKEDQVKEAKGEDVKMNIDNHSQKNMNVQNVIR